MTLSGETFLQENVGVFKEAIFIGGLMPLRAIDSVMQSAETGPLAVYQRAPVPFYS